MLPGEGTHLGNYLSGPLASYVSGYRLAGGGALLEAVQPSGDVSQPAHCDYVLTVAITPGIRISADFGAGPFSVINPADGLYLTPPDAPAAITIAGRHRIRCLGLDPLVVESALLERASTGDDLARLYRGCFTAPKIAALVNTLWLACEDDAPPARLLADHAAVYIARTLALQSEANRPADRAGGLAPWQLRRVTEAIAEASDDKLSLAELARLTGLSVYHFARAFKKSLGVPPYAYQRKVRLDRARLLLLKSGQSITEIAHGSGFSSSQAFARAFSREFGASPTLFRRQAS